MLNRRTSTALTTACVGMAVGAAAYMMSGGKGARSKTKQIRRNTGKALRQLGDFIGDISYMVK